MHTLMRPTAALALGAAILLTAGCTAGSAAPTAEAPAQPTTTATPETTPTETTPAPDETPAPAPGHADPAARAAEAALAAQPGAVISVDAEGGDVWSVLVRTDDGDGVELYVDATSGEVQRQRPDDLPGAARSAAPQITAIEAIDIALGALTDGRIRELDLDTERGAVVWEILTSENGALIEFYIDATMGDILKQELDD